MLLIYVNGVFGDGSNLATVRGDAGVMFIEIVGGESRNNTWGPSTLTLNYPDLPPQLPCAHSSLSLMVHLSRYCIPYASSNSNRHCSCLFHPTGPHQPIFPAKKIFNERSVIIGITGRDRNELNRVETVKQRVYEDIELGVRLLRVLVSGKKSPVNEGKMTIELRVPGWSTYPNGDLNNSLLYFNNRHIICSSYNNKVISFDY